MVKMLFHCGVVLSEQVASHLGVHHSPPMYEELTLAAVLLTDKRIAYAVIRPELRKAFRNYSSRTQHFYQNEINQHKS